MPNSQHDDGSNTEEFVNSNVGDGPNFKALVYNHKLRRKLGRALNNAKIDEDLLVRQRAIE